MKSERGRSSISMVEDQPEDGEFQIVDELVPRPMGFEIVCHNCHSANASLTVLSSKAKIHCATCGQVQERVKEPGK